MEVSVGLETAFGLVEVGDYGGLRVHCLCVKMGPLRSASERFPPTGDIRSRSFDCTRKRCKVLICVTCRELAREWREMFALLTNEVQ